MQNHTFREFRIFFKQRIETALLGQVMPVIIAIDQGTDLTVDFQKMLLKFSGFHPFKAPFGQREGVETG
jgi:hypothetical protein